MPQLTVDAERCAHQRIADSRCRACVDACPHNAWQLHPDGLGFDTDACDDCGQCVAACPLEAPPKMALPKPIVERLSVATGTGERMPLPLSATLLVVAGVAVGTVLPLLETIAICAVLAPTEVGMKLTFSVQVSPASKLVQEPATRKLAALVPDKVTLPMEFCVRDNGKGIARNEHKRIFEKFYRVDDLLARQQEGSGLGLSIVQHVMKAHRGKVEVDSEPGRGSTFTLFIPTTPPTLMVRDEDIVTAAPTGPRS